MAVPLIIPPFPEPGAGANFYWRPRETSFYLISLDFAFRVVFYRKIDKRLYVRWKEKLHNSLVSEQISDRFLCGFEVDLLHICCHLNLHYLLHYLSFNV